jgi:hypothetical protein
MKLFGKHILLIIADGSGYAVNQEFKRSLQAEGAYVFTASPHAYLTVESLDGQQRGQDLVVDIPLSVVDLTQFQVVVLLGGSLAQEALVRSGQLEWLVRGCEKACIPFFITEDVASVISCLGPYTYTLQDATGASQHVIRYLLEGHTEASPKTETFSS